MDSLAGGRQCEARQDEVAEGWAVVGGVDMRGATGHNKEVCSQPRVGE